MDHQIRAPLHLAPTNQITTSWPASSFRIITQIHTHSTRSVHYNQRLTSITFFSNFQSLISIWILNQFLFLRSVDRHWDVFSVGVGHLASTEMGEMWFPVPPKLSYLHVTLHLGVTWGLFRVGGLFSIHRLNPTDFKLKWLFKPPAATENDADFLIFLTSFEDSSVK